MKNFEVPVFNDGKTPIELGLEPEGDVITLAPGDRCTITAVGPIDDWSALDFSISCREGLLSISFMRDKEAFLNDDEVRGH